MVADPSPGSKEHLPAQARGGAGRYTVHPLFACSTACICPHLTGLSTLCIPPCLCSPCATFVDPTVHAKSRWEAALGFFYPLQHLFSRVDVSGITAPQLELVPQRHGPPLLQVGVQSTGMLLLLHSRAVQEQLDMCCPS